MDAVQQAKARLRAADAGTITAQQQGGLHPFTPSAHSSAAVSS